MQSNCEDSLPSPSASEQYPESPIDEGKKLSLKQRKAGRRVRQLLGKNRGRWTSEERREYYVFLRIYSHFFTSKEHRRIDKVYRMMANFIRTRTPDQCRTHHQKLEYKYHRTTKILEALRSEFGVIEHDQIVRKCEVTSTTVATPSDCKERDEMLKEWCKPSFMEAGFLLDGIEEEPYLSSKSSPFMIRSGFQEIDVGSYLLADTVKAE